MVHERATRKQLTSFNDLLEVMNSTQRASKLLQWPTPDGEASFEIRLWCLSDEEHALATVAAQEWAFDEKRGIGASPLVAELRRSLFDAEEERQILLRALRRGDDASIPLVVEPDDLRRVLTPDARLALMRAYNGWVDECSPIRHLESGKYSAAEMKAMLRDFRNAGQLSDWLDSCDFASLKSIVLRLADQ